MTPQQARHHMAAIAEELADTNQGCKASTIKELFVARYGSSAVDLSAALHEQFLIDQARKARIAITEKVDSSESEQLTLPGLPEMTPYITTKDDDNEWIVKSTRKAKAKDLEQHEEVRRDNIEAAVRRHAKVVNFNEAAIPLMEQFGCDTVGDLAAELATRGDL